MARIDISFKNTTRDKKLYKLLYEMEDRSYLIKEALRSYFASELDGIEVKKTIQKETKPEVEEVMEDEEINIDLDDF